MECCSGGAHVNTKHKDVKLRPRVVRNISLQSDIPRIPNVNNYMRENTQHWLYLQSILSHDLRCSRKTRYKEPGQC